MHTAIYTQPVSKLLTYAPLATFKAVIWPDYTAMGISSRDIAELIRLATDQQLRTDDADDMEFAAPTYAIHILAQLRAEAAIEPLITLFEEDNEWLQGELTYFYSTVGMSAIPTLQAFINRPNMDIFVCGAACEALKELAQKHPASRAVCIHVLTEKLKHFKTNDSEQNSFLILHLAELQAQETLPLIEQVFAAHATDDFIISLDDVLIEMGLKESEKLSTGKLAAMFDSLPSRFAKSLSLEETELLVEPPTEKKHQKKP